MNGRVWWQPDRVRNDPATEVRDVVAREFRRAHALLRRRVEREVERAVREVERGRGR